MAATLPLALALSGAPATATPMATPPATPAGASARVLTSGRFVTVTHLGIELVDEDGSHPHVLVRRHGQRVRLAEVHAATQTLLWSSGRPRHLLWHVSDFYGAQLGSFRVPRSADGSTPQPAIDPQGYVAYWVRPGTATADAALMQLPVDVPSVSATLLRDLGPGAAGTATVSPDDHWVAVDLEGRGAPATLRVVGLGGRSDSVLAPPVGQVVRSQRVVWSPDADRLAVVAGAVGDPASTLYAAPVVGAGGFTALGPGLARLLDWSPDGRTVLGTATSGGLVGEDVVSGAVQAFPVRPAAGSGVFWSGLRPGAVPHDRTAPRLTIGAPRCVGLTATQCHRLRHRAYAWQQAIGTARDSGGSGLRYVIVAAFEKRQDSWWGLVGNGKHPHWRRFPTRVEARYGATERTARLDSTGVWTIPLPGVTRGTLVLVAKAADAATNVRTRSRTVALQ